MVVASTQWEDLSWLVFGTQQMNVLVLHAEVFSNDRH